MKISIITVCKNAEKTIERTLLSVVSQNCYETNVEYWVIDGASTDKTVEIIKKYGERYRINWISEADGGIYDAMNKGLDLITGEIVYFLNAGDYLIDKSTLSALLVDFEKFKDDFLYANVRLGDKEIKKFDKVCRYFLFKDCICHQGSFYKKSLFAKFGKFNKNFKIAADYELLLKIMQNDSVKKRYWDFLVANYDLSGVSSINKELLVKEKRVIRKVFFSKFERVIYGSPLYRLARKAARRAGFEIYV